MLATIWLLILAFGSSACLLPMIQAATIVYQHFYDSRISYGHHAFTIDFSSRIKNIVFILLGSVIGYPVASASGNALVIKLQFSASSYFFCFWFHSNFLSVNCYLFVFLVGVLKGLWRNDLVAMKGSCPNCGEEVWHKTQHNLSITGPRCSTRFLVDLCASTCI